MLSHVKSIGKSFRPAGHLHFNKLFSRIFRRDVAKYLDALLFMLSALTIGE